MDHLHPRDPSKTQAWLIGGGITSLTAALHLIKDARVPGSNIHILDANKKPGGGMTVQRGTESGYFLPFECNPYFHGSCTERLLSLIPCEAESDRSIMDTIRARAQGPTGKSVLSARQVGAGPSGLPELFHLDHIKIPIKHRMALIKLLLQHESTIDKKPIRESFDPDFFETDMWTLWSTIFALQPWHSAGEFQRHLHKYLGLVRHLTNLEHLSRTEFNLVESVVVPLISHLRLQGVDFRLGNRVTDLKAYPEADPTTISEIELTGEDGRQELIALDPVDIVIVTLGSTGSGAAYGTNTSPPSGLTADWEDLMEDDWKLWEKLARMAPKFGNPTNFLPRIQESILETFTTTIRGPAFASMFADLSNESPENGALLLLRDSNWRMTVINPHQPIFRDQPEDVTVIQGFALNPTAEGNFIKKPMCDCTGEEVFQEVLSHLCRDRGSVAAAAKTIPCGMPLGTAPYLTRGKGDRPAVIPENTTNIACVGQFVEIAGDTSLEVEYSVRGAQIAVAELMDCTKPLEPSKHLLTETLQLLV
ncbi:oleate hydratase [Aspergillus floccosus]